MPYPIKPIGCDPARVKGLSERMIVSHYENNYCGAVKRLNLIEERLGELDYATAAGFLINGLKREELIAMNSMILHELFFEGLGDESEPDLPLRTSIMDEFGSYERWRVEFTAMGKALGGGSGWVLLFGRREIGNSSISGHPTTATPWRAARRFSRSTCTSTPITSILAPRPAATSMRSWALSGGATPTGSSRK